RVASKWEPDVQDSANQAGGGFFPQAATLQLRQKKTALVARNPKKAKNAGDYLKQEKATTLLCSAGAVHSGRQRRPQAIFEGFLCSILRLTPVFGLV
ncbi:hypothetical protein, partial [Ruminococcus difficilis]